MARKHGFFGKGGRHRGAVALLYLILMTNIQDEVEENLGLAQRVRSVQNRTESSGSNVKDFEFNVQNSMFHVNETALSLNFEPGTLNLLKR